GEPSARFAVTTNLIQIRRGPSLRRAAKSLSSISRSHAPICRWVQRLGPILGSIGADPREVHRIFVDETMVNLGGTPAWIWIAFEPDLRAMPDFHVVCAGTRSMHICSSGGPSAGAAGSRSTPIVRDGARTEGDL
ncbi:MAG: hypothetical protein RXS42_07245, partial [Nitrososphaeria archaeon]